MKITKNGIEVIDVPKGAYKSIYKDLGYKPVADEENTEKPTDEKAVPTASTKTTGAKKKKTAQ